MLREELQAQSSVQRGSVAVLVEKHQRTAGSVPRAVGIGCTQSRRCQFEQCSRQLVQTCRLHVQCKLVGSWHFVPHLFEGLSVLVAFCGCNQQWRHSKGFGGFVKRKTNTSLKQQHVQCLKMSGAQLEILPQVANQRRAQQPPRREALQRQSKALLTKTRVNGRVKLDVVLVVAHQPSQGITQPCHVQKHVVGQGTVVLEPAHRAQVMEDIDGCAEISWAAAKSIRAEFLSDQLGKSRPGHEWFGLSGSLQCLVKLAVGGNDQLVDAGGGVSCEGGGQGGASGAVQSRCDSGNTVPKPFMFPLSIRTVSPTADGRLGRWSRLYSRRKTRSWIARGVFFALATRFSRALTRRCSPRWIRRISSSVMASSFSSTHLCTLVSTSTTAISPPTRASRLSSQYQT
eukprot:m.447128 g.447128  ORF g.447128 m.447128 type:complete len:400 (+) comp20314_c1_seq3:1351-2550(+)